MVAYLDPIIAFILLTIPNYSCPIAEVSLAKADFAKSAMCIILC